MKMKQSFPGKVCLLALFVIFTGAQLMAQKVTGVVVDDSNTPIPGVTVIVKGTTIGGITNSEGSYSINPGNVLKDILVFSFVGFETKEVNIDGQKLINVKLKTTSLEVEEVVAIGYGTIKKRDLTGSVSSVKADIIGKTASSNAMQAMQGRVAGLDIQQSDGQAGAGLDIKLRGNRSITANNSPLILVDGVDYGSTLDINPTDIESMEILKDASSTAIYGTKGANGVIIITTKHGKAGKTKVSLNAYLSSNIPTNIPQIMYGTTEVNRRIDAERYKKDLALVTAGTGKWGDSKVVASDVLGSSAANSLPYTEMDIYNDGSYTNWSDIILQNGLTQNYEVSVSGGNEKTNFNLSLGTMYDEGLLKNDKMDRYNVKTNIDHKISDKFKIGTSILYTYKNNDQRANVFGQALKMTSIAHPYDADGNIIYKPSPTYEAHANPLLDEIPGNFQHNIESTRFFGNAYVEITPVKNISFKSMLALDRNDSRDGQYADYLSVGRLQGAAGSYISVENKVKTGYTWENTLNYNTSFGGSKHNLTGMLGQSSAHGVTESRSIAGNTAAEHYYQSSFYDLSKIQTTTLKNSYIKSTMLSFFGRLNYKYMDKYLLTASLRTDGSSVLAKGHKWGYFPSVALGWRMKEESFLKNTDWLDNLKLRTSWGLSGNAAVDPYGTLTILSTTSLFPVYYYMNTKEYSANIPTVYGNENLTWEKTSALNFGLDFGILKNRISGSVDVYFSHTNDLLYMRNYAPSNVFASVLENIGKTKGSGVELGLNTLIVDSKNFKWDVNWTAAFYKDEITSLYEGLTKNINDKTGQIVGQPVIIYFDYQADGCWGTGEFDAYKTAWLARHPGGTLNITGDPGTIKLKDVDDDGKLTDADKKVYNRSPKAVLGMNNTFSYKNLSLSVLLYARLGGYLKYDFNSLVTYDGSNWGDVDYWTPENQGAKFPTPGNSTNWSTYGSAALYENASYVKVKDITLSYSLPKNLIAKVGIGNVKLYGSLKNYFTFSKIDNYDSERGGANTFPLAKQVIFGVNVEF